MFVATSVYSMARQRHRNAEKEGTLEDLKMSKRRLKSDNDKEVGGGGGKMYLMAGLVSLVAVGYFVYQVLVKCLISCF